MELAKCVRCEKLYNRINLAVCRECELLEDKEILAVSSYMRDHPGESLETISDNLSIYLEDIERWIEEKRLTVTLADAAAFSCIFCGAPITMGRICKSCGERMGVEATKKESKINIEPNQMPSRSRNDSDGGSAQKYRRS